VNNPSSGLLYWLEDKAVLQAMKRKKLISIDHHTNSSRSSSSMCDDDGSDGSDSWSDVKQLIIADVLSSRDNG
jgi:hypothetical protein